MLHAGFGLAAGGAMFLALLAFAGAAERLQMRRRGAALAAAAAGFAFMAAALACFAASLTAGWAALLPEGL